jgi:hypothetical protein
MSSARQSATRTHHRLDSGADNMHLTDLEIVRILDLCARIARAQTPSDIPALPDGFDGGQTMRNVRRRALPTDAMVELGALLAQAAGTDE